MRTQTVFPYLTRELKDILGRAYNQLDRWSLRAARLVVTVCKSFADDLAKIGIRGERIVVQHNMVKPFPRATPESVAKLRAKMGLLPRDAVLLCVGRLSKEKAQCDLVEAVGRLTRDGLGHFVLVIVGDGPEREHIRNCADELGISDRVIMVGQRRDVSPFFAIADVMVLPSHSEGCPNVLLEAMANGVTSIATRVGGVPDLVQDREAALLVDKGDISGLADEIRLALHSPELRRSLAMKAYRESLRYSPKAYCESLLRYYERALGFSGQCVGVAPSAK